MECVSLQDDWLSVTWIWFSQVGSCSNDDAGWWREKQSYKWVTLPSVWPHIYQELLQRCFWYCIIKLWHFTWIVTSRQCRNTRSTAVHMFCLGMLCWRMTFLNRQMKFPLKYVYISSHMAAHQKLARDPFLASIPVFSHLNHLWAAAAADGQLPVGLPDVDGLRVSDVVLQSLLIQQVEKVFNSQRYRATGAEDGGE